ncbi:hypothetical protein [Aeromonas veronii]|uniref:hypothetical protein n=1 Tax=Aeromonas veronii TaxID=654 RepID=UPI003D203834
MQTIKDIQNVIAENNGFIPSHVLADIIGREHRNLTAKLKQEFSAEQLLNFSTRSEEYVSGNNAIKTRSVYLLPEREAMALSMSYDVMIGMQVYEAYQAYRDALNAVIASESHEEAVAIASQALYNERQAKAIQRIKNGQSLGHTITKMFEFHQDPLSAWEEFKAVYLNITHFADNEKQARRDILDNLRSRLTSENSGLRRVWMKARMNEGNFDNNLYLKFKDVERDVLALQSRLRVMDKNENGKMAIKAKDVALKVADIAKQERRKNAEIIASMH